MSRCLGDEIKAALADAISRLDQGDDITWDASLQSMPIQGGGFQPVYTIFFLLPLADLTGNVVALSTQRAAAEIMVWDQPAIDLFVSEVMENLRQQRSKFLTEQMAQVPEQFAAQVDPKTTESGLVLPG